MFAKPRIVNPIAILGKCAPALGALVAAAVVATTPIPAVAQDDSEARLRRAEAEIRALQRAVFPGGDGRFFEPQITADGTATGPTQSTAPARAPSTSAVTDILARLDAIDLQLQRLTALSEENTNSLSMMDERITALEERPIPQVAPVEEATQENGEGLGATESNLAAMTGASEEQEEEAPAVTGPSPERSRTSKRG